MTGLAEHPNCLPHVRPQSQLVKNTYEESKCPLDPFRPRGGDEAVNHVEEGFTTPDIFTPPLQVIQTLCPYLFTTQHSLELFLTLPLQLIIYFNHCPRLYKKFLAMIIDL